ncbi:MAG: RNA ligase family protein [Candidatus Natronoplasma sp.]
MIVMEEKVLEELKDAWNEHMRTGETVKKTIRGINVNISIKDFPKLESPFVREYKTIEGEEEYVLTPEVQEGYGWVFEDEGVIATEKLNGSNVCIVVEDHEIMDVFNRQNRIEPIHENKWNFCVVEGLHTSLKRGYVDLDELEDGLYYGELVGPNMGSREETNPYDMEKHVWLPFETYCKEKLRFNSWGKYPKTFESIKRWFKDGLIPLFYSKWHGLTYAEAEGEGYVEGIVFHHPDGRKAKLRYDMFEEFLSGEWSV